MIAQGTGSALDQFHIPIHLIVVIKRQSDLGMPIHPPLSLSKHDAVGSGAVPGGGAVPIENADGRPTLFEQMTGWFDLVAGANLSNSEKSVCYVLVRHIKFDTGITWLAMDTIAKKAGLCDARAARRVIGRLVKKGVVIFARRSVGGRGPNALNHLQLVRAGLKCLCPDPESGLQNINPDSQTGLNGDLRSGHPGSKDRAPRTQGPGTPDPQTPELSIERTNEPTTTTAARGGGGRGARAELERRLFTSLVGAGVNRRDAQRLASLPGMSVDLIAFASERAVSNGANHRGKYVATLLRKSPDELDGWDKFREDRVLRRVNACEKVLRAGGTTTAERKPFVQCQMDLLGSVWASVREIAEEDPIGHDALCDPNADLTELFQRLVKVAQQHADAQRQVLEASAPPGLECPRDHQRRHAGVAGKEVPWRRL